MACVFSPLEAAVKDYPIRPVPFTAVRWTDGFWAPRLETNRTVTIPFDFKKCRETGRIDNFAKAAGRMPGPFKGIRFDDSDVYKIIEGASYSLALHYDPSLDRTLDSLAVLIAGAQEKDGYLYTARTIDPDNRPWYTGEVRWSYLAQSHELYNVGHFYEAAVAHFLATGKRSLLDVAIKNADLIAATFGPSPGQLRRVPGHQEIEIGLVKLYRVTGQDKYLSLAKFFLEQRGNDRDRQLYGSYAQDHVPVVEQKTPVGHAVRAGYMYSGMADVAVLLGDTAFTEALERIWTNYATAKLYLTGGVGARHEGEAFGDDYELPNLSAYCETCAAIAFSLWNQRMFLLHGNSKFVDLLERALYNGFLSGVSVRGDCFFYTNPLESDGLFAFNIGKAERQPWFDCSCCPSNVVRFLPSLPGYAYAAKGRRIYINLFAEGSATVELPEGQVSIDQKTRYPWEGKVSIAVRPGRPANFEVAVRIPGWAQERPVPSDLYRYAEATNRAPRLSVNGKPVPLTTTDGYVVLERLWRPGDKVELDLPMPVRRVFASDSVRTHRGLVALERGPLVYCVEGADFQGDVFHLVLPDDAGLRTEFKPKLINGVQVVAGEAVRIASDGSGGWTEKSVPFTAIPYYAWAHRGPNQMRVWMPRTTEAARHLLK
jgi:DUF1680 family protein